MDDAGDLLEDSWFFGNLLHTKTTTVFRSYSDLASSSCLPPHPYSPLSSTQESIIKNERKSSSFSLRKQPPVAPTSLTRTPSLPTSIKTQSFAMIDPNPSHSLTSFGVGSNQEDAIVKNERKSSSLSSRKQPPVAPPSVIRTPSLPTSTETESFLVKNPNQNHDLTRESSIVGSDQENAIQIKSSSLKQPPTAPSNLTRRPSLPNAIKTQSFPTRNPNPSPNLTLTSSMSTPVSGSDQEVEDEDEDEESEFTLGRLIRQASMKLSDTSNPPQQTSKSMTDNLQKKPEQDQEKSSDLGKLQRNRSKITKNKYGGGAPAIQGGLVDKSSSEDMKAHIKFWARAVASNVRQECS